MLTASMCTLHLHWISITALMQIDGIGALTWPRTVGHPKRLLFVFTGYMLAVLLGHSDDGSLVWINTERKALCINCSIKKNVCMCLAGLPWIRCLHRLLQPLMINFSSSLWITSQLFLKKPFNKSIFRLTTQSHLQEMMRYIIRTKMTKKIITVYHLVPETSCMTSSSEQSN